MKLNIKKISAKKLVYTTGILLIIIGLAGLYLYFKDRQTAIKPVKTNTTKTVVQSSDEPSEAPVSASDFANVPADQPRELSLPSIQTKGYIQKIGIDKNNQIAVPTNIHLAGWYTNSVKPGYAGLSIIDGHVQGRYRDAIFKDLAKLKPGDVFSVTYGDNSKKSFIVKELKTLPLSDTIAYLMKKDPNIKNQLNLITCGGNYDKKTQQYDKRVIVKSESI